MDSSINKTLEDKGENRRIVDLISFTCKLKDSCGHKNCVFKGGIEDPDLYGNWHSEIYDGGIRKIRAVICKNFQI